LICLAGAAGTGARYLIALWAAQRFGSSFPYGTLIVNLADVFQLQLWLVDVDSSKRGSP
jgi:CrcB protein